jgi:type II secretory pathway component GspD/PulD (secretin)
MDLVNAFRDMTHRFPTVEFVADEATNTLMVSGADEDVESIEQLIEYFSMRANRDRRERCRHQIRVLWLANDEESGPPVSQRQELASILKELAKSGISGLHQVGQVVVSATPDADFQLSSRPWFDDATVELELEGNLTVEDSVRQLEITIGATRMAIAESKGKDGEAVPLVIGGVPQLQKLVDLNTTIDVPLYRFVILGAVPTGQSTSVFLAYVSSAADER